MALFNGIAACMFLEFDSAREQRNLKTRVGVSAWEFGAAACSGEMEGLFAALVPNRLAAY